MSKKGTTIHLSSETKQELDKLKVHPRQPYEEIIKKLLEEYKKVKPNVS
jgi:predicted DNA-binding protein